MKNECVELNELISAFADGELDGEERLRAEKHLEVCAPCRAFVQTCRRIDGAVAGAEPPAVDAKRWEAMRAQLRAAAGAPARVRRSRIRPAKAIAFVLTAAAACLLVAVPFLSTTNPPPHLARDYYSAEEVSVENTDDDCYTVVVAAPEGGLNILVVADTSEDPEEENKPAAAEDGEARKSKSGEEK